MTFKLSWKVVHKTEYLGIPIRILQISGYRDGRYASSVTPMRIHGHFELDAKKILPSEIPLLLNMPISIWYKGIKTLFSAQDMSNKLYNDIEKNAFMFLAKTDHIPGRVFALGLGSTFIKDINNYGNTAILKSSKRYLRLPVHNDFDFITSPLFYGINKSILNEIIKDTKTLQKELNKPIAGFVDMRNSDNFKLFLKILEEEKMFSLFDIILIKWANPRTHITDYYALEDIVEKTYNLEKYSDFPPVVMVATQRSNSYFSNISGIHHTQFFGGDLHNVFKKSGRFIPDRDEKTKLPPFFDKKNLTIHRLNDEEFEKISGHPLARRCSIIKEFLEHRREWTKDVKILSKANAMSRVLESYDSTKEFGDENKYLINDEPDQYVENKPILKKEIYKLRNDLKRW